MKRNTGHFSPSPLMVLILFLPLWLKGQVKGTVTYVSDGDTFHMVTESGEKVRVRVADIDCPERSQVHGLEAKEFTLREIGGREVTLQVKVTDRYGRKVASVTYGGKDLSEQLLVYGHAWHFKRYSGSEKLAALERSARDRGGGLWAHGNHVPPWEYRRRR